MAILEEIAGNILFFEKMSQKDKEKLKNRCWGLLQLHKSKGKTHTFNTYQSENQTSTFFVSLTSSDVLIPWENNETQCPFKVLFSEPLELNWIRGWKLTSKFRAVQFWVHWKKITTKAIQNTVISRDWALATICARELEWQKKGHFKFLSDALESIKTHQHETLATIRARELEWQKKVIWSFFLMLSNPWKRIKLGSDAAYL